MKPFTYHAPTTVDEAVAMLEQYQASCAVVAGGTDVIIELNERHKAPEHVIAIDKLSELRYIKEEGGLVKIGALTSFDDLENDAYVQAHLPALLETAVHVGSPQIRNLGTVAGTLVEILNRHNALALGAFKYHLCVIGEEGGGAVTRHGRVNDVAAYSAKIADLRGTDMDRRDRKSVV